MDCCRSLGKLAGSANARIGASSRNPQSGAILLSLLQFQIGSGEQASLGTAFLWAVGALCFATAGRVVGSRSVNRLRLVLAATLIGLTMILMGHEWRAPASQIVLLASSGLIGLALGDAFYFESLVVLGPRRATLITCLWPVFVAILQLPLTGEGIRATDLLGMALVIGGVMLVVRERATEGEIQGNITKGILFGIAGAGLQALGVLVAKAGLGAAEHGSVLVELIGMPQREGTEMAGVAVSPISGTFLRMAAAAAAIWLVTLIRRDSTRTFNAMRNRKAMGLVVIGTVAGPVVGVALSLYAVANANSAVASTLMSTMPIMVIPMVILIYREKVSPRAWIGTAVTLSGVAVLMGFFS